MTAEFIDFLTWEKKTRDTLDFKKIYIDMAAGDILAGLALSELVYWYLPDATGGSKLRVKHDDQFWIVSARYDWWDRCRLTPRQSDRALAILKKIGLIRTKLFKWNNSPTVHIQIVEEKFIKLWDENLCNPAQNPFLPNGENVGINETVNSILPNGEIDFTAGLNLVTETTAKTTTETKDFANTPSAVGAGEVMTDPKSAPEKKPAKGRKSNPDPVPAALMNPMKDAIAAAFGWHWDGDQPMSEQEKGVIQKAARSLCNAKFKSDDIPKLYAYCIAHFDHPGPMALATHVSEFRTAGDSTNGQPTNQHPARRAPANGSGRNAEPTVSGGGLSPAQIAARRKWNDERQQAVDRANAAKARLPDVR